MDVFSAANAGGRLSEPQATSASRCWTRMTVPSVLQADAAL
jgi:hypothetical protein